MLRPSPYHGCGRRDVEESDQETKEGKEMKDKNRTNENQPADDPKRTVGRLTYHRSTFKRYLENFTDNAKITLSENPMTNEKNYAWVKKNLREIVNAVQS
jgi:hypothetical protein